MTFSSSGPPPRPFVERPLPGPRFVSSREPVEPAPEPVADEARPEDLAEATYARGLEAGRREAEAAQQEALGSAIAALDTALAGLREREQRRDEALAHAALSLAIAVARQLLRREIETDADALAPCLADALAALPSGAEITLFLAPADLARLEDGAAATLAGLAERWNARVARDARLRPGESRVEAAGAQVELSLDPLLARLERALRERLAPLEAAS